MTTKNWEPTSSDCTTVHTRRQHISSVLEERASARPTAIANYLTQRGIESSADDVIDDILEISNGREILVSPPRCRDCYFSAFEDKANIPTRCPDCQSLRVEEPRFTIETE